MKRTIIALVCGLVAPLVCTNEYDHDRRNNVDRTVDRNANNDEHNLRDRHCKYI